MSSPLPTAMTLSGHASPLVVIVVTIVWTAIAVIAVLLRLYCRLVIARNPGYDDALLVIAACLSIGLQIGTCLQGTTPYAPTDATFGSTRLTTVLVQYGLGQRVSSLPGQQSIQPQKTFYACIAIYCGATLFIKESICVQYYRVFPQKSFRWLCRSLMVFIFVWSVWSICGGLFRCRPIRAAWEPWTPGAQCLNSWALS